MSKYDSSHSQSALFGVGVLLIAVIALGSIAYGIPQYHVWEQSLSGKAELQKAEYTRQVAVLEAQAKLDSAEKLKEVRIKEAEGIAEANKIIGASLKNNPEYLTFLQIQHIADGAEKGNKTYFVAPNQGGLPILTTPTVK
jgi:regulator of protease activity HflC (stomatin/prohibitin superfamily)